MNNSNRPPFGAVYSFTAKRYNFLRFQPVTNCNQFNQSEMPTTCQISQIEHQ